MLSRSYPISIKTAALAKKRPGKAEHIRDLVSYLDTGGAAQYASMIALPSRLSNHLQMCLMQENKMDRSLKSWLFAIGLSNTHKKRDHRMA